MTSEQLPLDVYFKINEPLTVSELDVTTTTEFTFDDSFIAKETCTDGVSVLAVGDPHFRLDNLSELSSYIQKIVGLVQREQPTFVVLLGDLLHTHENVHTTVVNKAYTFIYKLSQCCPVYVIVGNHDYINNSQFLSDAHWMNAMKMWDNVHIVDRGMVSHTPFGKFIFCPYVFPGRFHEALNIIDEDWQSARAIFCHQEFAGCKMGAMQSVDGDAWELASPYIVSGHIHDKQLVQENIYYTGSSMQHAFGESHDKTITMCHFDTRIRFENLDLNMPHKKIMYKSLDDIEQIELPHDGKDKLRITLSGTHDQFKLFKKSKKYKELTKQGVKLIYRHKSIQEETATNVVEDFHKILYGLVQSENNPRLIQLYQDLLSE